MSDATYRIDTDHRPSEPPAIRWAAYVISLSDGLKVGYIYRETEDAAVTAARAWIIAQSMQQEGHSVYVDDQGEPVEQHSVRT